MLWDSGSLSACCLSLHLRTVKDRRGFVFKVDGTIVSSGLLLWCGNTVSSASVNLLNSAATISQEGLKQIEQLYLHPEAILITFQNPKENALLTKTVLIDVYKFWYTGPTRLTNVFFQVSVIFISLHCGKLLLDRNNFCKSHNELHVRHRFLLQFCFDSICLSSPSWLPFLDWSSKKKQFVLEHLPTF